MEERANLRPFFLGRNFVSTANPGHVASVQLKFLKKSFILFFCFLHSPKQLMFVF